ncbi:hypothetical protein Pan181_33410 [Aeoliella mucimassa]|uniref:Competence protein A n=2 Tax=Aeoliella mucimassa TaxID=2527972 RepID=A0A518AQX5_9BACT|nr:hypothetical protein Pan181_33410 [Aeoliella mucimassa]
MLHAVIVVERPGEQQDLAVCRSLQWRASNEPLHAPETKHELTAALTKLSTEERLAGSGAVLLLSSEMCVTRAVTGTTEHVNRETGQLRERSQLYLMLGPGRKVIASSSTPLDARHSYALLSVATEQTLQVLKQTVEASGMEVDSIQSSQVALARTVHLARRSKSKADLVISVNDSRVELGVMGGGRMFLDYRPGGGVDIQQLGKLLVQHHTRLCRYCQRHHGLEDSNLTQIVVSGPRQQVQQACDQLAPLDRLQVFPLETGGLELPWELRGEKLTPELAAAIGGALTLKDEEADRGPNLVEELTGVTHPPLLRLLLPKLAPMAAAVLLAAGFMLLNWTTNRNMGQMKFDLAQLAPQAARSSQLRMDILADQKELEQLSKMGSKLSKPPYSLMLKNLTQSIPDEIWLASVRIEGAQTATLAGSSYTESSIYDLVGNLQHLPGTGQVALQGTGVGRSHNRDSTTFDISMDLDLTGRNTRPEEAL